MMVFQVWFCSEYTGIPPFNISGSLSTALLWKLSRLNFKFPRKWNNIKKVFKTVPAVDIEPAVLIEPF